MKTERSGELNLKWIKNGIFERPMGFYERKEKVLASPHYYYFTVLRVSNCFWRLKRSSTVYLYIILINRL